MKDLVVIGAGPAGLTAAIYAARAGLDFAVLEQDGYGGGQIVSSHEVQNYPGTGKISGEALGEAFRNQALEMGAEIQYGVVESVVRQENGFRIQLQGNETLECRTVIAATGAVPAALGIPGEAEYTGNNISYCALCDGSLYKGKNVLVIGGGDTAVEDALYLSAICKQVTIALRSSRFRAAGSSVEQLKKRENVRILENTKLIRIEGGKKAEKFILEQENREREETFDGAFIAVGIRPASDYLKELPLKSEDGYIAADETGKTNIEGLYVAGDLRKKALRQLTTAVSDGANAAASAVKYLQEYNG